MGFANRNLRLLHRNVGSIIGRRTRIRLAEKVNVKISGMTAFMWLGVSLYKAWTRLIQPICRPSMAGHGDTP